MVGKTLKILFINPFLPSALTAGFEFDTRIRGNHMLTLNVGMAYIATAVERAGIDIEVVDCDAHMWSPADIEMHIRTKSYDAVGIGTMVFQYSWVRDVARMIKEHRPDVPIIVGSTLSTSMPEMLLEKSDVDIGVLGEGDITIVELLQTLDEGRSLSEVRGLCYKDGDRLVTTPARPIIKDINTIPFPNYDHFEMEIYLDRSKYSIPPPAPIELDDVIAMPVNMARGCPFRCSFCFHAFQHTQYRRRSPENVIEEIQLWKDKYDANFILFWDELSFTHERPVRELADMLIDREMNMSFFASCRSELFNWDRVDLARKLKQAGCKGLAYSLESGSDEILEAMNKRNCSRDFITQSHVLEAVGIKSYTSVIFGYPQETFQTIDQTFNVLAEARSYTCVSYIQPTPATPIYEWALENGKIPDEEAYLLSLGEASKPLVNLTNLTLDEMVGHVDGYRSAISKTEAA